MWLRIPFFFILLVVLNRLPTSFDNSFWKLLAVVVCCCFFFACLKWNDVKSLTQLDFTPHAIQLYPSIDARATLFWSIGRESEDFEQWIGAIGARRGILYKIARQTHFLFFGTTKKLKPSRWGNWQTKKKHASMVSNKKSSRYVSRSKRTTHRTTIKERKTRIFWLERSKQN